jgi:exosome complex component MTR3
MTRSVLSNCYVPVKVVPQGTVEDRQSNLVKNRSNGDGEPRTKETLRRLYLETSILSTHAGSSLVELGHTKILCKVSIGTDGNHSLVETGVLLIRVDLIANFGTPPHPTVSSLDGNIKRQSHVTAQVDMEARIHTALLPALNLADYPKAVIQVDITILQNDGSILSASLLAATLALADARVDMYDLVTCCEVVALQDGDLLADPTLAEEQAASSKMALAIMPSNTWKEVTLWQQSGPAPSVADGMDAMMNLCRDGCRTLHRFVRQHLVEKEQQQLQQGML